MTQRAGFNSSAELPRADRTGCDPAAWKPWRAGPFGTSSRLEECNMRALPKHVEKGLHELIEDGIPVDEIAYVMALPTEAVAEEIEHLAENKEASQNPGEMPKPRPSQLHSRGCPYSPKTQIEL
jgi:hypothetical protein